MKGQEICCSKETANPAILVKGYSPYRAHLQPLKDVCVTYQRNRSMGLRDMLQKIEH